MCPEAPGPACDPAFESRRLPDPLPGPRGDGPVAASEPGGRPGGDRLERWRGRVLAVVGLGQIGGSLAAAARPLVGRVLGFDRDPAALDHALAAGWVDAGSSAGLDLLREADAVVLAVPLGAMPAVLEQARPFLRPGVLLTDTGSVKGPVVAAARQHVPAQVAFVGGHPMAGTERWGAAAADPGLFRGCTWVLTPAAPWGDEAARPWIPLLEAAGARVLLMDPVDHDRHVALASHLPLLVAAALAGTARRGAGSLPHLAGLVAGGFRDTTRVAGGHPVLGRDMLRANWVHLAPWLEILKEELDRLARAVSPAGPGEGPAGPEGRAGGTGAGGDDLTALPQGDEGGDPLFRYLDAARRFREAILHRPGPSAETARPGSSEDG